MFLQHDVVVTGVLYIDVQSLENDLELRGDIGREGRRLCEGDRDRRVVRDLFCDIAELLLLVLVVEGFSEQVTEQFVRSVDEFVARGNRVDHRVGQTYAGVIELVGLLQQCGALDDRRQRLGR